MLLKFLRENETVRDFHNRCTNTSAFDCSEEEMIWLGMGSKRLPLKEIVPWTVFLIVIFVTGLIGNVSVCVVIYKRSVLHNATNYYLFSLAISDLLLLVFGLPNDVSVYWQQYPYPHGIVFCKLRALISEAASYVSILTIVAFSLERYLAICHPLHLYTMAGLTRALKVIGTIWTISISCAVPFAVFSEINYMEYPPGSGNKALGSAFCALSAPSPLIELSSIFFFIVPGFIIVYLYAKMAYHIRYKLSVQLMENNGAGLLNGQVHGQRRQLSSRKAILRMLAAVVFAFFACWTPFHGQRLFIIYGSHLPNFNKINEHLFNVGGFLYYIGATVNPILYNVMSSRYRNAFMETFLCRRVQRRRDSPNIVMDTVCREVPTNKN